MKNWPDEIKDDAKKIIDNFITFDGVVPSQDNILNVFKMSPNNIKVVILGQDPYPTPGVATGYAFSVVKDSKIPQSLKNIFKELESNFGKVQTDETLEHWISQGVFLLNCSLTTIELKPGSHKNLWKDFTLKVIKWIDQNLDVVWLLWGNHAKSYEKFISNSKIIKDAHPSPLSVRHRSGTSFIELNDLVKINW